MNETIRVILIKNYPIIGIWIDPVTHVIHVFLKTVSAVQKLIEWINE